MKNVFITGGSGTVGFQLVNHFLKKGYYVITTSRNILQFLENKEHLLHNSYKQFLQIIEVDFIQDNAVETILTELTKKEVSVQTIIHNARSLDFLKIENDYSISDKNFQGEFFVNVVFPYKLTMALKTKHENLKNIIFISSMYGVVAPTPSLYDNIHASSPIHYGVSKAAQIHLTKELAVRLSPDTRVNCVSFGGIKGRVNHDFEKRYSKLNPQGKMLAKEDVIGPVDFLVSEESKNMTGQNIKVDGGWTIW